MLPSLEMLRLAAQTALSELCERYWLPQHQIIVDNKCLEEDSRVVTERNKSSLLLRRLFAAPTEATIQEECRSFCTNNNSQSACSFVTALIDRTILTGQFAPIEGFCFASSTSDAKSSKIPPSVRSALEQVSQPLCDRLFSPKTPTNRIRPFCDIFIKLGIEPAQWKRLSVVIEKRAIHDDVPVMPLKKQRLLKVPWTPLGTPWSWTPNGQNVEQRRPADLVSVPTKRVSAPEIREPAKNDDEDAESVLSFDGDVGDAELEDAGTTFEPTLFANLLPI